MKKTTSRLLLRVWLAACVTGLAALPVWARNVSVLVIPSATCHGQPMNGLFIDGKPSGIPEMVKLGGKRVPSASDPRRSDAYLVSVPEGLTPVEIDTGRPDWHVERVTYSYNKADGQTISSSYNYDSPKVSLAISASDLPADAQQGRPVAQPSGLKVTINTCAPASPPAPPPPPVNLGKNPCPPSLADEYTRILQARAAVAAQLKLPTRNPLAVVSLTALNAGVDQLAATASEAADKLRLLGDAIALQTNKSIKEAEFAKLMSNDYKGLAADTELALKLKRARDEARPMLAEWAQQFQRKAAAATNVKRALPGNTPDMLRSLQRMLDQLDIRKLNNENLAYKLECELPPAPAAAAGPSNTLLLGLHPPLDLNAPVPVETISKVDAISMQLLGQWLTSTEFSQNDKNHWDMYDQYQEAINTAVITSLPNGRSSPAVHTPEATVKPSGTAFLVHRDAARQLTFVYVSQGSVWVQPARGAAVQLAAGQAALAQVAGARLLQPQSQPQPLAGGPSGEPTPAPAAANPAFEPSTDRRGSDYAHFDLPQANPQLCFERCQADKSCRAWTFVKPGALGPSARCFLKNPAPAPARNDCCVSGAIPRAIDQQGGFEVNVDRYGSDYTRFELPVANPDLCFERCRDDGRCAAWSFVRPGVQGPQAVCYLKNPAPAPTRNDCCVSGVKPGGSVATNQWVEQGVGDCPGQDTGSSHGEVPDGRRCTGNTAGQVAICWDGTRHRNTYGETHGAPAYPWCTYKALTNCGGGQSPGRLFVCK